MGLVVMARWLCFGSCCGYCQFHACYGWWLSCCAFVWFI